MIDELRAALRTIRVDTPNVAALRDALYAHAFARGDDAPRPHSDVGERELARRLSDANQGRDTWRDGWRIERVDASRAIVATRGGHRRTAKPGEYATTFSQTLAPRAGMAATLLFPRESLTLQAHVYYAFGETLPEGDDEERPLRAYIHAAEDALPDIYRHLTASLNRIPFTLKTMLAVDERDRRDATVLYVPRRCAPLVEPVLLELRGTLPGVPLFTRELARGIGIAESPGGGESFGMHRCRLVAEGIVDAWRGDESARLAAIERRFRAAGIDWAQPHRSNARVVDHTSRNRNVAVVREDGTGEFIKRLRVPGAESLRMLEREAAVYQHGLGDLAPTFIRFDRDAQTLVLALVPDAENVARVHATRVPVEIAVAAARTLRAIHALPIDDALLERRPPGIYTAHRGGPLVRWLGAGQMQLIDLVRANAVLAPALDSLAAEWRCERFIHGDVKWENCLWTRAGELKWIDWELAARGDANWDAGCFAYAYLTHPSRDAAEAALRAFLAEFGGDERAILRCAAARLIQQALEVMHGQPRPTELALALLERSVGMM